MHNTEQLRHLSEISGDSAVLDFVKYILETSYGKLFLESEDQVEALALIARTIGVLQNIVASSPAFVPIAIDFISQSLYQNDNPDFWYQRRYYRSYDFNKSYIFNKAVLDAAYLKSFISSGCSTLDFGAGKGILASVINSLSCSTTMADTHDFRVDQTKHIPWHQIVDDKLPDIADKEFDIVLVNLVLHHIDDALLPTVLQEIARVGKKAVIIDHPAFLTRDEVPPYLRGKPQVAALLDLPANRQRDALALLDFWGNFLAQGLTEMSLPFNYKTISEWQLLMEDNGYTIEETRHRGFPDHHLHHFYQFALVAGLP